MPVDRLSRIVEGEDASLAEMRKLSKALRIPLSTLVAEDQEEGQERVSVLLRQTLDQREHDTTSSMAIISEQLRDIFEVAAGIPTQNNWLDLFRDLQASVEQAENFAAIFRRAFAQLDDYDSFSFLSQTLEELGVLVAFGRDPQTEGVSAFAGGHAVILLAPRSFRPRMLFTLAHETGHLVARHGQRNEDFAFMDSEVGGGIGAGRQNDERFADAFASSLLLPRSGVLRTLELVRQHFRATGPLGDVEILALSRIYNVSFEVAARRCEYLGLLPGRGARALYQRISDDFGNPERRAEELGLAPRGEIPMQTSPSLVAEAARLVRDGRLSAGRAAELVNVPVTMLFAANSG
jgi:Zn-dependent peptidase ImmA (M78 family)